MTARWSFDDALRAAALGLMVSCAALTLVALVGNVHPGWGTAYLVPYCGLVAVESYCTHRGLHGRLGFDRPRLGFRAAELATLFAVLQLTADLVEPHAPLVAGWPYIDLQTVSFGVLLLLYWLYAGKAASEFARLGARPSRDVAPSTGEVAPARSLALFFSVSGAVLFVAAACTQPRVADMLQLPHTATPGPLLNVLAYFLLAAVVLAEAQLASLQQRWHSRDVRVLDGTGSTWARYTAIFVALVAFLALLLPTSHTIGLLDLGRGVWEPVSGVIAALWHDLARFFTVSSLPHREPPNLHGIKKLPHLPPPPAPHRAASHGHAASPAPWTEILKLALFWLLMLAAVGYAVATLVRRRVPLRMGSSPWHAAGRALRRLRNALHDLLRRSTSLPGLGAPARAALRISDALPTSPNLVARRLGRLDARQQVIHYYLTMVRMAGRRGVPRRDSQTPQEYSLLLRPRIQDAAPEAQRLTDAFVEARYSAHHLPPGRMDDVRHGWPRIRRALRTLRPPRDGA